MINRRFITLFFLFLSFKLCAQEIERINGSPFPYSSKPDTIYVVYDQNFLNDEVLIIQSLQGILSKTKPSIYRDVGTGSSVWLNNIVDRGLVIPSFEYSADIVSLLAKFKDQINGYVLCDLHTTSSNIAISLSGILNSIPVTEKTIEYMKSLNIPLLFDARDKDYSWLLENFSEFFNKNIIIYQDTLKDLCLGDYSVFSNSIHFFDDIQSNLVDTLFKTMNKNSFLLGWGKDEFQTVNKSSLNSISVLPSDYAYNLSVLTNFNSTISQKKHDFETNTIDSVHTVCFLMSDGDNIQWLLNWFITDKRWFGNENRGKIDIGWTISPALSELAPTAMQKIYQTASLNEFGKDYFIAGPSGTGYIYPEKFEDIEVYTKQLNQYMFKSDLKIVNLIGNNFDDFYFYSFLEKDNIESIFYYDFSNYSKHDGEIRFINNKPIISARYNLWGGFNTVKQLSQKINSLDINPKSSSGYSLIPVHNWSNSVDSILLCSQLFNNNIRIVSPDKFVNLIEENIQNSGNQSVPYITYPNPTNKTFYIELRYPLSEIESIEVYDLNGVKQHGYTKEVKSINEKATKIEIDISQLDFGMFFFKIRIKHNKNVIIDKILRSL